MVSGRRGKEPSQVSLGCTSCTQPPSSSRVFFLLKPNSFSAPKHEGSHQGCPRAGSTEPTELLLITYFGEASLTSFSFWEFRFELQRGGTTWFFPTLDSPGDDCAPPLSLRGQTTLLDGFLEGYQGPGTDRGSLAGSAWRRMAHGERAPTERSHSVWPGKKWKSLQEFRWKNMLTFTVLFIVIHLLYILSAFSSPSVIICDSLCRPLKGGDWLLLVSRRAVLHLVFSCAFLFVYFAQTRAV